MYNIVYSITFHQDIDFVNHFLKNIEKYNIENNYLVIIHLSDKLFKIKDQIYQKNVIINPIHYNKQLMTHLLMKPFIENCEYLISKNIKFDNFITLTSSNRLVRQAPKFEYKDIKLCENKVIQNTADLKGWHWPKFLKNKKIVNIYKENKIKLIGGQVSGRLYHEKVITKICKFIRQNGIMKIFKNELCFEEIILPSLANYYMKTKQHVYCHTFWGKSSEIPTIDDVVQKLKEKNDIYIIKRFPNNMNHKLFKALDIGYFSNSKQHIKF